MFRAFQKPRIGIVLNGGGARGPFQIGVYIALKQHGYIDKIKAMTASSVGAFSATLFLLEDEKKMIDLWKLIDNKTVKANKDSSFIKKVSSALTKKAGYYSRDKLIDLMTDKLDLEKIYQTKLPIYFSLAKRVIEDEKNTSYKAEYIQVNNLKEDDILTLLMATSAIPMVFDPVPYKGNTYVDPMMADNEPIKPLLNYDLDYVFILPLNNSHLTKTYSPSLPFDIVDFACPQMMELKLKNMIDFDPTNQDSYISLGYFTADTLLSLLESKGLLANRLNLKKRKELNIYSLSNLHISDIRFDIMNSEDILKLAQKRKRKKL